LKPNFSQVFDNDLSFLEVSLSFPRLFFGFF
jgi:hypothetical protein